MSSRLMFVHCVLYAVNEIVFVERHIIRYAACTRM